MGNNELEELNDVICEIRRCLNFFQDETETSLYISDFQDNYGYIDDEDTGNKYKIKVEKIK